jgi:hypothetical protein
MATPRSAGGPTGWPPVTAASDPCPRCSLRRLASDPRRDAHVAPRSRASVPLGDARCALRRLVEHVAIATLVVVARIGGGVSRYDLVLDLDAPRVRVVVEVKVRAELTASAIGGDAPRTEIDDYLALAERARRNERRAHARRRRARGEARSHRCFGGHVYSQEVHDALARLLLRDSTSALEPAARLIAEQCVGRTKDRDIATLDSRSTAFSPCGSSCSSAPGRPNRAVARA